MTVFYQISERPLMTIGGGQFVSDAIDLCGGRNIFAGATVMAPMVNIESVIAADPEAIMTARPDRRQELAGVLAPLPGPAARSRRAISTPCR